MPEVPRYPYDKLTPEHVEAIGLIIIQWANAEKAFTHILARLVAGDAGDADMALVSVTGMRDRPITGLIKSIVPPQVPGSRRCL